MQNTFLTTDDVQTLCKELYNIQICNIYSSCPQSTVTDMFQLLEAWIGTESPAAQENRQPQPIRMAGSSVNSMFRFVCSEIWHKPNYESMS